MASERDRRRTSGSVDPLSARREWVGLLLLVAASGVTTIALVLVESSQPGPMTAGPLKYGGAFLCLYLTAFFAMRFLAPYADPVILPCVALLNGLGLVLIHRLDLAAAASAARQGQPIPAGVAGNQMVWTAAGVALFVAVLALVRDYRALSRYTYTFAVVGLALILVPAVLPARFSEVNGGKNWILLFGYSIQPGEFAKVILLISFASLLVAKRDLFTVAGRHVLGLDLPRARDLGPLVLVWLVSILVLVFEKNLGFSLLVFGTVLAMLYIATQRISWVLIGVAFFAVGCWIAYNLFAHVRVRFDTWRDPFADYADTGYQLSQSLFGLATGGLFGTGLGQGSPQMVPFANTDFIISTVGEELGLFGLAAVLSLYLVIVIRGFRAALTARDSFGKLLAAGLSFTIAWQMFVVVGGVTALIPLTGLTSPFLSYGGSSLLANFVLLALLIRISSDSRRPPPSRAPADGEPIADARTEAVPLRPRRHPRR
ncbi:FtsW/RodA/SpoVE family cell cycle protein [Prescottella agglutinans]|uniref:Cell division protein FtsW (Lipid II flippase) n=1 Tax=Prescottella agglutinans TaxID=1644129 RepID=A0ABT6MJP0_9NOCA|nr:FtsW/RodA/SpoVE family cell cycle protein [Prescottella agglutinans]MDH6283569.1 cell division protein FtsW (lipid II flippase) [Prescottella agglutinans]